jgi:enoyl-CoA hydratase/carnithine racemase
MSYENVAIDYIDHVAILKLNAPEVLNALSPNMVQ